MSASTASTSGAVGGSRCEGYQVRVMSTVSPAATSNSAAWVWSAAVRWGPRTTTASGPAMATRAVSSPSGNWRTQGSAAA
ncbi:hypothetical protein ASF82_04920 [Frigoribacterium sp. Leaf164]|nr:hypothetical protein ASF82_04920 [Frigoribacterium sp. Leaf164]